MLEFYLFVANKPCLPLEPKLRHCHSMVLHTSDATRWCFEWIFLLVDMLYTHSTKSGHHNQVRRVGDKEALCQFCRKGLPFEPKVRHFLPNRVACFKCIQQMYFMIITLGRTNGTLLRGHQLVTTKTCLSFDEFVPFGAKGVAASKCIHWMFWMILTLFAPSGSHDTKCYQTSHGPSPIDCQDRPHLWNIPALCAKREALLAKGVAFFDAIHLMFCMIFNLGCIIRHS